VDAVRLRGDQALREGRWAAALADLTSVAAATDDPAAWLGIGEASWWLGRLDDSVAACRRAYTTALRSGDRESAVRCAAWLSISYTSDFGNRSVAHGWVRRAQRLLPEGAPGALHALVWVAHAHRLLPDAAAAAPWVARALDAARRCGDRDLELVALAQSGHVAVARGDLEPGFALLDEAAAAALGDADRRFDTVVFVCCDMLGACALAGDTRRAGEWCRVAEDFTSRRGCPFLYVECRTLYGALLLTAGRWAEADRLLTAVLTLDEKVCPAVHARAVAALATLRVRQGRLDEARAMLDRSPRPTAELDTARAEVVLADGDPATARRLLERRGATSLLCARAQAATGDLDAATATAAALDPDGPEAVEAAGLTAAARGRVVAAVDAFETAAARWADRAAPFEAARCLLELAESAMNDDPTLAAARGRTAVTIFRELGAVAAADRSAALLRRLGVRGPGIRATARTAPGLDSGLTAREREVLDLLAVGLTNPEIAGRLFVSRKTVAHHVSHILRKLGVRNRSEAAAYAAAHPEDGSPARCAAPGRGATLGV